VGANRTPFGTIADPRRIRTFVVVPINAAIKPNAFISTSPASNSLASSPGFTYDATKASPILVFSQKINFWR
jgi:hypothetical protein